MVFKQSVKRQFELEEKHRSTNEKMRKVQLPVRELEIEKRQEGLEKAIDTGNKGYQRNTIYCCANLMGLFV